MRNGRCRRRGRNCGGSGSRSRRRTCRWGRRVSRRWSWCRRGRPSRYGKGINFIVRCEVNATASDDARVPLARICHQFVRATARVNHCAGGAIVAVQTLVALSADDPYNRVVSPVGSCNPRRTLAGLAHAPGAGYGGRICRSDLVSGNRAAPVTKNKICPLGSAICGSRLTCSRNWQHSRRPPAR